MRSGAEAPADLVWRELGIRMDARQAAYRQRWLRAALEETAQALEGEELASDLELACELYLRCGEALRREIRTSFGKWTAVRGHMLARARSYARRLSETCEARWLRLGLAAISIDDTGTDFRDSYVALGNLYVCAVRCGMEPGPYFKEAATHSSGVPNVEQASMRDFLLSFEGSAYFREAIVPNLG